MKRDTNGQHKPNMDQAPRKLDSWDHCIMRLSLQKERSQPIVPRIVLPHNSQKSSQFRIQTPLLLTCLSSQSKQNHTPSLRSNVSNSRLRSELCLHSITNKPKQKTTNVFDRLSFTNQLLKKTQPNLEEHQISTFHPCETTNTY